MIGRPLGAVVLLGLPGAGKTTLAEGLTQRFGARLVSRDEIRCVAPRAFAGGRSRTDTLLREDVLRRHDQEPRMSDESIAARIERLVAEEHDLRNLEEAQRSNDDALADDRDRLSAIEVELDRCWDLLRQRRALRSAGGDPDDAAVRDSATVEGYLQ
jgi:uncharacterized protein DUF2630/AAA domain-containing protein